MAAELTRSPLVFDFKGNTVTVSTSFEYRANAWAKPLLVTHHVSCGMGKERPRLNVTVSTTYDVTSNWHLKTKSRLVKFDRPTKTERDQCEVSFLHIDVTEKVIAAVTGVLEKELAKLDTTIGKISIEKPVDELWDKLQRPISIAKGKLWFRIRPQEVALGPITATDSTLTARLDLQAKPRIRAGERPPNDTVPLPPLGRTKAVVDTVDVLHGGHAVLRGSQQGAGEESHREVDREGLEADQDREYRGPPRWHGQDPARRHDFRRGRGYRLRDRAPRTTTRSPSSSRCPTSPST